MRKITELLLGKRDNVEARRSRKLRLESLEDRHLLDGAGLLAADIGGVGAFDVAEAETVAPAIMSGIVTVTLGDDGPINHSDDFKADGSPNRITLREAFDYVGKSSAGTAAAGFYQGLIQTIEISESVETIELDSQIVFEYTPSSRELDSTITVNGNSATIARDGGRAFTFLGYESAEIEYGATGIILNDLQITGCGTTEEIESDAVRYQNNTILSNDGGGIYASGFSNFTLSNCAFTENVADSGGVIFTYCDNFVVSDCVFESNSSINGGGAIAAYHGGVLSNSRFEGNSSSRDGGVLWTEEKLTLDGCDFVNNSAGEMGGVLWTTTLRESDGTLHLADLTVTDCCFTGNSAQSNGGAIFMYGSATIGNSSFTENVSGGNGGAVNFHGTGLSDDYHFELIESNFSSNSAGSSGGAVSIDSKMAYVDGCVFEANSSDSSGGAVYSSLRGEGTDECTFQYVDCTFDNNIASAGGGVYVNGWHSFSNCDFESNTSSSSGGAIRSSSARLDVNGGVFEQNSAQYGGAVYGYEAYFTGVSFVEDQAQMYGGAVGMSGGRIDDCTFTGNTAGLLGGSAVYKSLVTSGSPTTLSITESHFEGNYADGNGTVYVAAGVLTIQDVEFVDNTATGNGGAVMFNTRAETTLDSVRFSGNIAGRNGGAVYAGGKLSVDGCAFENNAASASGGGVYSTYADLSAVENSTFDGNAATTNGGALCFYAIEGTQTLKQNEYQNNVAANGGAIYLENDSATSEGEIFYHNGASEDAKYGGAIYLQSGALTLNSDSFESNGYYESVGAEGSEGKTGFCVRGGAIYNAGDGAIVGDSLTFDSNYGYYGGAIYNKGVFEQTGGAFSGNEAYLGGAVYNHAQGVASFSGTADSTLDFEFNVARFSDSAAQKHGSGGAIYQSGSSTTETAGSLLVSAVQFLDNVASKYGGAIANYHDATTGGSVVVDSARFDSNVAGIGGAIANAGDIVVGNSTFAYNAAYAASDGETFGVDLYTFGGRGGAIYSANNATTGVTGNLTLVGSNEFYLNSATVSGGALNIVSGEVNFGESDGDGSEASFEYNTAMNGFGGAIVLANGLANVNINATDGFSFANNEAWYANTIAVNAKFGDDYKALVEAFGFDYSTLSLDQVATFTRYAADLKDETLTFEYLADFSAEHSSDYVSVRYVGETSTGEVTLSAGQEVTLRELGVPYDEAAGHCVSGSYKIEFYYGQTGEESPDNLFELVVGVTGDEDYMTIRRITMNGDNEQGERQLMEGFSFITYDLPIESVSVDWGDGSKWRSDVGSFSTNVYHMFPAKGEGADDDTYSVACDLKLVGSNKHIVVNFDYQAYGLLDHIAPKTIETYFDDALSAAFADEDLVADLFND